MATIGLKMLYTGLKSPNGDVLKDEDGLSESGVYEIDTNKLNKNLGTKTANITGLSGTLTKITGNNQVVDVTKPDAAPSVAIDSNMINPTIKQKMLGKKQMTDKGWVDQSVPVEAGLIIESQTPITLKSVFFAFGRGHYSEASQNVQTNTDTAQTREDDNLTFTALGYSPFDGKAMATYYEDDDGFDRKAMFDTVFPGNSYTVDGGNTSSTPSNSTTGGSSTSSSNTGSSTSGSGKSTSPTSA